MDGDEKTDCDDDVTNSRIKSEFDDLDDDDGLEHLQGEEDDNEQDGVKEEGAYSDNEFDSLKQRKSHKKKVFYNPEEYGPDDVFCRRCFKPFVSLRGLWSHVSQLKPCRKFYGEDAILEMRESLSALPPVSPSTQALRIAQQREKSRDYFEKHRQEVLKKRKRMFNESKDKGEDENQLQEELDNSHCKHCFKPFKNLRGLWSHIAQMVPCRKFYGEDALVKMKKSLAELYKVSPGSKTKGKSKTRTKPKKVVSEVEDDESVASDIQDEDELDDEESFGNNIEDFVEEGEGADNSEEAKMKRQLYYEQNKPTRLKKQREYYQKNRERMVERQHTYYQNRRELIKERQSEYYRKNRMEIRGKRILHYRDGKVKPGGGGSDISDNAGPKKFVPVPDPETPQGILNIPSGLGRREDEVSDDKPFYSVERQISPLGVCNVDHAAATPGASKIDHENVVELTTLPVDSKLSSLILSADDCDYVDSFVAMSLSNDGESVEVKYILRKDDITLEGVRDLLHAVLCVLEIDLFNFISEKSSPVLISPTEQLPLLRNRFTKEILANNKEKKPIPPSLCNAPSKNFETHFISDEMLEDIPYHQLLLNPDLALCDTGCVGVQFRRPDDGRIWLAPIFSVNMEHHWRHYTKMFYTILVNWVGSKALLTEIVHRLPCGVTSKNQYFEAVKEECFALVQQPRDVSVCEHCGEQFEFYKYLFSEKNKYKHHVESHKLTCKKCGETFPNATVRIFHERTHRQNYVPCTKEGCKWVGRSDKSLQTHIRIFHTHELCDLCGKEFANSQSLALHMTSYHLPKKPNNWFCEVCGKGYSSKNILDKHVKRHFKENSLVNKWMHDSPNEYKYECTKHNNCKKYFKTEAQFKRHMKTFATRDYPTKCATQYRPDIDPSGKDFIRDVPLTLEELQAQAELEKRSSKKKKKALKAAGDDEDGKEKLKKLKNKKKKKKKHEDSDDPEPVNSTVGGGILTSAPSISDVIRPPAFVIDAVNEALKPAFANHLYIPGDPKGELGAESLSRSSSVAPNNPPSGVVSPSVDLLHQHHQRQRLREELRVDEDMKQEPDDQAAQMHYRTPPPPSLPSRSHPIFNHLHQQASAQHSQHSVGGGHHLYSQLQQQQHLQQPQQHDPNFPHWMAVAHHALYNNSGGGASGSGR